MKSAKLGGSVANLNKLIDAGRVLREIHPDMTLNQVLVFCLIAGNAGITQRQIMERLSIADSSASRIVSILSKYGDRGTKPMNLLEIIPNEINRRTKSYQLTPLGRRVCDEMILALR